MTDAATLNPDAFRPVRPADLVPAARSSHPPRILMLYGSLRERSFSRFATEEAARMLTALGAEPRAGPIRRAGVQWDAEDRDLGVVDLVDVLDERALQECPALAGEMRLLAADERRDRPVVDRGSGLEAVAQAAVDLLAQPAVAEIGFDLLSPRAFGVRQGWIGSIGHEISSQRRLVADRVRRTRPGRGDTAAWTHSWHVAQCLSSAD